MEIDKYFEYLESKEDRKQDVRIKALNSDHETLFSFDIRIAVPFAIKKPLAVTLNNGT